jgi:acyl-CoA synthetase (AMP-forming)/AMP-acid ligase II
MGLILNTMVPFYTGAVLVLLPVGMHRIHSWLKAIEQYGGTFISAPDIAYLLCVKSTRHPEVYNLSSLRVALNASEPIHLKTYQLFEEAFNLENVMVSGYGLAEATVAVTMHPPGQPAVIDANGYVASGKPVDGVDIKIEIENEKVGEILVKSPALMSGYYNKKTGTDIFDELGYLRTGDVGYLDSDGYLFVLSRKKNIIIHGGHTLYPDDVEQVVVALEDVRKVAALGVVNQKTGSENLYLFAELRKQNCSSFTICHDLAIDIVQRIYHHFGIRPARVYLLKPKSIPHTPNGKLRYAELRKLYTNDLQNFSLKILYP